MVTSSIRSQRPGRWKPSTSSPVLVRAERVLELVAVAQRLDRRDDGFNGGIVEAPEPREGVAHLLLLLAQLALVGEHLPGRAGVRRERLDPLWAGLEQLDHVGLGERALRLRDPRPHAVAGHGAAHEHHEALRPGHAGAAVGEPVDRQLELVAGARARLLGCLGSGHGPTEASVATTGAWSESRTRRPPGSRSSRRSGGRRRGGSTTWRPRTST